MPEFKCSICSEILENGNDLMKHKKEKHINKVPYCRQINNCKFGPGCWYRHDNENMNNDPASNSELLKKLINMMEIFSDKIANIEKNMK